jgi:hypothetical protein
MIDYAYRANCLQSFLGVFSDGQKAAVRPRFNCFLASSDTSFQLYYHAFYSPGENTFLEFLGLFFQNVRCNEDQPMFSKFSKIDTPMFTEKTDEYLNVCHSAQKNDYFRV